MDKATDHSTFDDLIWTTPFYLRWGLTNELIYFGSSLTSFRIECGNTASKLLPAEPRGIFKCQEGIPRDAGDHIHLLLYKWMQIFLQDNKEKNQETREEGLDWGKPDVPPFFPHLKIQTSLLAAKTHLSYGIFQVEATKLHEVVMGEGQDLATGKT